MTFAVPTPDEIDDELEGRQGAGTIADDEIVVTRQAVDHNTGLDAGDRRLLERDQALRDASWSLSDREWNVSDELGLDG